LIADDGTGFGFESLSVWGIVLHAEISNSEANNAVIELKYFTNVSVLLRQRLND
jgi:hypothetical protein